jgi:hypothetical protein
MSGLNNLRRDGDVGSNEQENVAVVAYLCHGQTVPELRIRCQLKTEAPFTRGASVITSYPRRESIMEPSNFRTVALALAATSGHANRGSQGSRTAWRGKLRYGGVRHGCEWTRSGVRRRARCGPARHGKAGRVMAW